MPFPEQQTSKATVNRFGHWNITEGENQSVINLWIAAPLTMATDFFAGMVEISGGSFFIVLMVVGSGVPMRTAVTATTAILAATACTGFLGNALQGGFDPALAIPCGIVAMEVGLNGGKIALKTKPKSLKSISGFITNIAAVIKMANTPTGKKLKLKYLSTLQIL